MIKLLKDIWAGPFSVKLSLVFVLFVLFCMILVAPGPWLFLFAIMYSLFRIFTWIVENE